MIQLKGHPTFVSDAMAKDMMAMIDLLAELDASEYPRCVCMVRAGKVCCAGHAQPVCYPIDAFLAVSLVAGGDFSETKGASCADGDTHTTAIGSQP